MQIIIFYLLFSDWSGGISVAPASTVTSVICCAYQRVESLIGIGVVRLPTFPVLRWGKSHHSPLPIAYGSVLVILCGAGVIALPSDQKRGLVLCAILSCCN